MNTYSLRCGRIGGLVAGARRNLRREVIGDQVWIIVAAIDDFIGARSAFHRISPRRPRIGHGRGVVALNDRFDQTVWAISGDKDLVPIFTAEWR